MLRRFRSRFTLTFLAAVFLLIAGFGAWVFVDLPDPRSLSRRAPLESTKIYDRHGTLLYEMPDQDAGKRTRLRLSDFPLYLRQATIATEDATFYANPGVDVGGIVRALLTDIRGHGVVAGGSTITQQLIRVAVMSPQERDQRSLRRKVREAILAIIITRLFSKDAVLEAYLNEAYYGNMAYGAEAAAQAYFGKSGRDLDLAESALLAGLTQSPAGYNPLLDPVAARRRQAVVLDLMVSNGFIPGPAAEMAKAEEMEFAPAPFDIRAPHFVTYVKDLLDHEFGGLRLNGQGLRVITTLDLGLQSLAESTIRVQLGKLKEANVSNASLVALDPHTGDILALAGSANYFDKTIDGAVNVAISLRQPGSSIKPITYAAAFARGWSPATIVADVRTAFPTREGSPFVPANYDYTFRGPVSLRQALASSINVPAVKVLEHVGLASFIDFAHEMGISSLADDGSYGLSLTLGGGEVTLLELSSAYAVFANEGLKQPTRSILRVEDNNGRVLYRSAPGPPQQVLDPRVAFLISDILSDDDARRLTFGSYSPLRLSHPAAVKTGTTSSWRDNWTIGYTPNLAAGVWAGNADGSPMKNVSGVSGAAPIWHDFMEEAAKVETPLPFVEPAGLVHREVCPDSGQLPGPYCPYRKKEVFLAGSEPKQTCTVHQLVRVCTEHNRLATEYCPMDQVIGKVFAVYPPELAAWAEEMWIEKPPSDSCPLHGAPSVGSPATHQSIAITSPDAGSVFALDARLPASIQRIEIAATSTGDPASVLFLVDGSEQSRLRQRPYSLLWPLSPGEHTIAALALDPAGNELARSEVHITVTP